MLGAYLAAAHVEQQIGAAGKDAYAGAVLGQKVQGLFLAGGLVHEKARHAHEGPSFCSASLRPAAWMASTILLYPVQRHRFPLSPRLICSSVGSAFFIQKMLGAKDHAPGAKAALHRAAIDEGLLQGVQIVGRVRQALYGRDLALVGLHGQGEAGAYRLAVDQNRAGPAVALVAADLGAGEVQILPQRLGQGAPGFHGHLVVVPVDYQFYVLLCHFRPRLCLVGPPIDAIV